jgi:ribosomal protein S18 acetylase RimI-like enzyme
VSQSPRTLTILVRDADPADLQDLFETEQACYLPTRDASGLEVRQDLERLLQDARHRGKPGVKPPWRRVLVAEVPMLPGERRRKKRSPPGWRSEPMHFAGYLAALERPRSVEIDGVAVVPEWRRHGVGRALVRQVVASLDLSGLGKGAERLVADVAASNVGGQLFFRQVLKTVAGAGVEARTAWVERAEVVRFGLRAAGDVICQGR